MATKILVLASNPQGTDQLRLNQEIREIEKVLERGKNREQFVFRPKVAVRVEDLQFSLQKEEARIVHFCGHGMGSPGLVLETALGEQQFLDTQAIADLFKLFANQVECVVLNACYSNEQAKEINQHINYVIGTKREIKDDAAIAFSQGFYEALGNGKTIEQAFEFGCNRIQLAIYGSSNSERKLVPVYSEAESKWVGLPQHQVIELLIKDPLNPIQETPADLTADRGAILQRPFVPGSPYKGLKKFNAKDKDLFFGRDRLIDELIEAVNQSNLVLVLGASGSGKSSVVRAGVLPQIENLSETPYQCCLFTPNRDPFVSFHRSLLDPTLDFFRESEVEFVREGKKDTISQAIDLLKSKHPQWLIFIDQFEELFTLCSNKETRGNFIRGIIEIAQAGDRSVKLILAMRSDFLEELSAYPRFAKVAQNNINLVADMQADELRQAIEQPAARHGVVFEPGLVDEIVRDVQGQAGSLPLLQYTLDLLWQDDDLSDRTLNIVTYRKLGGVTGALQKHVNEIYQDLAPEQQLATKQILLKLVDVIRFEKSEVIRTAVSKRAYKSEFTKAQAETVKRLVDESLLVSNDLEREGHSTVEIAHEALLSSWAELKEWITDARNTISLNNRLAEDAARWQELKKVDPQRANEELWSGGSNLEKAIELRDDGTFNVVLGRLGYDANAFIDASFLKKESNQKAKIRIRNRIILSLVVSLGLISSVARFAWQQMILAQIRESAAQAEIELPSIHGLFRAVSAAGKSQDTFGRLIPAVERSLSNAIFRVQENNRSTTSTYDDGYLTSFAFSPNKKYIVRGTSKGILQLLDLQGNPVSEPFTGHTDYIDSVRFSTNGKYIVSDSRDKSIRLWDLQGNEVAKLLTSHDYGVSDVAVTPDGKHIWTQLWTQHNYTWGDQRHHEMRVWDLQGNPESKPFWHEDEMSAVAFSPNGDYIVTGGKKDIRLWDWRGNLVRKPFVGHTGIIDSLAFSPNGNYIVSGSQDTTVRLWDLQGNSVGNPFIGHKGAVKSVAFSPDEKNIVSYASGISDIRVWNLSGKLVHEPIPAPDVLTHNPEFSVAFNANGKNIVGVGAETIIEWNLASNPTDQEFGFQHKVGQVAFSPNGKYILSTDESFNLRLWDLQGNQIGKPFTGHGGSITSVAFSDDGNYIASGGGDRTIRLWDLQGNQIGKPFTGHDGSIHSVAFSPNNEYIASGGDNGSVIIWDLKGNILGKHHNENYYIKSITFSLNEPYIFAKTSRDEIKIFDLEANLVDKPLKSAKLKYTFPATISSDEKYHIATGYGGNDLVQKDSRGNPLKKLLDNGSIGRVTLSPDNTLIAYVSIHSGIKILVNEPLIKACKKLQQHLVLGESRYYSPYKYPYLSSEDDVRLTARNTCLKYGNWSNKEKADFLVAEGNLMAKSNYLNDWKDIDWTDLQDWTDSIKALHSWTKAQNDFEKAKRLNSDLAIDPLKETQKIAVPALLKYGELYSKSEDTLGRGIKYFEQAKKLDERLNFVSKIKAKQILLDSLLESGYKSAKEGNIKGAIDYFEEAKKINSDLDLESKIQTAERLVESSNSARTLLEQARNSIKTYDIEEALKTYFEVEKIDSQLQLMSAKDWNTLCWYGSLKGMEARVTDACEKAVSLDPNNGGFRDSRGLARALRDISGAIEDFKAYMTMIGNDPYYRQKRKSWIDALSTGKNPFTKEEIESLFWE